MDFSVLESIVAGCETCSVPEVKLDLCRTAKSEKVEIDLVKECSRTALIGNWNRAPSEVHHFEFLLHTYFQPTLTSTSDTRLNLLLNRTKKPGSLSLSTRTTVMPEVPSQTNWTMRCNVISVFWQSKAPLFRSQRMDLYSHVIFSTNAVVVLQNERFFRVFF